MATNYERGRAFEYRVRKWYESLGCFVVRSAGSKGPVDLVVFFPVAEEMSIAERKPLLIQCKIGQISKSERLELRNLADRLGTAAIIATRGKGAVPNEVDA